MPKIVGYAKKPKMVKTKKVKVKRKAKKK